MAAEAQPPLHQSFRGALDATTDLDDDRLGTTVFPQGFAETARTHFHTLHERNTSTISFDDVDGDIGDLVGDNVSLAMVSATLEALPAMIPWVTLS